MSISSALQPTARMSCQAWFFVRLDVAKPAGTYFVVGDFRRRFSGDDVAFTRHLVEDVGVAAIPPSFFYQKDPDEGRRLVRFAFCKKRETLEAAAERLAKLNG